MSHYAKGAALEREIRQLFRDAGWQCIRGAGSKGRLMNCDVDLTCSKAVRGGRKEAFLVLVQAKRRSL